MDRKMLRQEVWNRLRSVALPDSRFDFDFECYIPDFQGSSHALERVIQSELYQNSHYLFITPDNCLEDLRCKALRDGKMILITTYGIRRGFYLLDPGLIAKQDFRYVATLDGMERFGKPLSLADLQGFPKLDALFTGASAINLRGLRFGKGHGYFDLEWGMLYLLDKVDVHTPVIAFVHDCQIVDMELEPAPFDSVCDWIFSPRQVIRVQNARKPEVGVLWDQLQAEMLKAIPILNEIKQLVSK